MASKSRPRAARKERDPNRLANLGLFDIPNVDIDDSGEDSEVDESVLESELEALLSGKVVSKPRTKKKVASPVDIEKLAADCLKDFEDDDDESNISGDEELLTELHTLSGEPIKGETEVFLSENGKESTQTSGKVGCLDPTPSPSNSIIVVLEERVKMYREAIDAAKSSGDSSKARRYERALKTLAGLQKSAKAGASINEEDLPPVVSIPKARRPPPPVPSNEPTADLPVPVSVDQRKSESEKQVPPEAPFEESSSLNTSDLTVYEKLVTRRDQYKSAALQAKKAGDKDTALNYVKTIKAFNAVIAAVENGENVDLANVPPPPPGYPGSSIFAVRVDSHTERKAHEKVQTSSGLEAAALAAADESEEPSMFDAPPPPTSILEALQQRLDKYSNTMEAAKAEGNNGKVRRLQRIIKSYETAIKDYKAGKTVDYSELPAPPGFAPIPVNPQPSVAPPVPREAGTSKNPQATEISQSISKGKSPSAQPQSVSTSTAPQRKPKIQRTNTAIVDKLEFLLERQKMFRQAALSAKQNGDLQQAKEYLRMSKGFDSMIEATKCGLPIDTTTIPTPPQLESDFVIVDVSECIETKGENQSEILENLQQDLLHQIEVCTRNKEHFLRLGDVSSASKFERLGLESKKDLTVIQHLKKIGGSTPRFHYETRLFSMVQCHTDLTDNDFRVTVERGINLPGKPDELDSYVKIEFPIPAEAPQRAKTHTVRDTNNPIFQEEFKFEINRKSRSQLRQFKRQALKLEVWSKGGFLRSDTILGTVNIKLQDLESKCTVHDSFNLMDGRKATGGKLEVKLCIRDPLLVKQVEEVREKWLVIGS